MSPGRRNVPRVRIRERAFSESSEILQRFTRLFRPGCLIYALTENKVKRCCSGRSSTIGRPDDVESFARTTLECVLVLTGAVNNSLCQWVSLSLSLPLSPSFSLNRSLYATYTRAFFLLFFFFHLSVPAWSSGRTFLLCATRPTRAFLYAGIPGPKISERSLYAARTNERTNERARGETAAPWHLCGTFVAYFPRGVETFRWRTPSWKWLTELSFFG